MPQLDPVSYFNQIVWFFFCFGIIYIYIYNIILPSIVQIFKTRQYKQIKDQLSLAQEIYFHELNIIKFEYTYTIEPIQKSMQILNEFEMLNKNIFEIPLKNNVTIFFESMFECVFKMLLIIKGVFS